VYKPRIVITSGEPAGIGPDACVALAQSDWEADLVVAGDADLLGATAAALKLPLVLESYDASAPPAVHRAGHLRVLQVPLRAPVIAGQLDVRNAEYVIALLDRACDGCMNGEFAAMVTAPVQKSTLLDAGFAFSGHTEYLATRTRAALPVMLLVAGKLRVALVTTHLPLAEVPRAITRERLLATLRIVHMDVGRQFDLARPRIAVLGLNPHAGESGHLGREEIDILQPVIDELRADGLDLSGPVPADTAFTPRFLETTDVIVAQRRELDAGTADLTHERRSRHGAHTRAHRECRCRQLACGRRARDRTCRRQFRPCRSVSASANTFCMTPRSSHGSSTRSPPSPASASSKSVPVAVR
jgi:4-hydroxythreonine-4-phosphate dehydrogenase